jgi:toxin ParE1/3/4
LTRRLAFRSKALADLDDIWTHTVDRWSVGQAQTYLTTLDETLGLLCDHPEIARLHDFKPPVRIFPFQSHLVIFVAEETLLDVIRILPMRSDWQVLLTD